MTYDDLTILRDLAGDRPMTQRVPEKHRYWVTQHGNPIVVHRVDGDRTYCGVTVKAHARAPIDATATEELILCKLCARTTKQEQEN